MGLTHANNTSFKKGNKPWTTRKKVSLETREKQSKSRKAYYKRIGGYPEALKRWQSEFMKLQKFNVGKWTLGRTEEKSPKWKGDNAGYDAIHKWLGKKYGRAHKCENIGCSYPKRTKNRSILRSPKGFNWALIHGKKYVHKRENFVMLCNSCHRSYDLDLIKININRANQNIL